MRITKEYLDSLTFQIIGAAIEVHKIMGSALLENPIMNAWQENLKFED